MTLYIITVNRPGYLPEADPYVVEDERAPVGVLEAIRDEIERAAGDEQTVAWEDVLVEIGNDIDHADMFDPDAGFLYRLPDGYVIEATACTREQLIELGYKPGEDFEQ